MWREAVGAGGAWAIPSAVAMDLGRGRLLCEGNCGPPTSSRAWCAFVASASSEEPGCVLFRMFYRTNNRQQPDGRRVKNRKR